MKKFLAGAVIAASLGWANPAAAEPFTFDFDGAGPLPAIEISGFDWLAGNTILDETTNTILYQANLNFTPFTCEALFGTTNNDCLTAVALLNVTPNLATPEEGDFIVLPGGTFQIWADNEYADDLTGGTAFADGTLILSSTAVGGGLTSFTADDPQPDPLPALDGFEPAGGVPPDDDWAGVTTITGTGGFANALTFVTYLDTSYFVDPDMSLLTNLVFTLSAGSNNLPFENVDPTALFWNNSPGVSSVCGPGQVFPNCVNGTGTRIMAESDVATTLEFAPAPPIPEPATLTLLGLGLLSGAAARRRQIAKK